MSRRWLEPRTLGASSQRAPYIEFPRAGAVILIAGPAVPNQIGTATNIPSPVIAPRPAAIQAPLTPQPTAGPTVTTVATRAILFEPLGSRALATPCKSPEGAAGRLNSTNSLPLCFRPTTLND
jgi:hypothetical protein